MDHERESSKGLFKLSPSDFAYLYEECKLCYCLKVKYGVYQPSMPMPAVFSAINTRIQGTLVGHELQSLSKDLPEGKVLSQEGWTESVAVPGTDVYIKGKYDLLVELPDKTFMLVDLKISDPTSQKVAKYKTQLGAYKFALEHPAHGKPVFISKMGLLVFYPDRAVFHKNEAVMTFPPKWLEVPMDEEGFIKFMKEIDTLLEGPLPPEGKDCKWCKYRHLGEDLSHKGLQEDIPF